jgi:hypothetical protein
MDPRFIDARRIGLPGAKKSSVGSNPRAKRGCLTKIQSALRIAPGTALDGASSSGRQLLIFLRTTVSAGR